MKKLLCTALTLGILLGSFSVSNAASTSSTITERSDIQVIIDGVKGNYTNNPIIVNGRTLLPLRELLTNLKVTNDDQHIIWDSQEKSVTAIKGSVKIYLKVGDTTAKINDKDTTIDAAPVNYNGRVYIPARFVGEAFDKVVVWDSYAKRVYIRDTTAYNEVKDILEKSNAVMDGLNHYRDNEVWKWKETTDSGEVTDYSYSISGITDNKNKQVYSLWKSKDGTSLEFYILNNASYNKTIDDTDWTKEDLKNDEFDSHFNEFIDLNEIVYAAMNIDKGQNDNKIHLVGYVSLAYLKNDDPTIKVYYDDCHTEIVIDKATNYVTQMHLVDKIYVTPSEGDSYLSEEDDFYTPSDFNGNYSIKIPSELQ